MVDESVHHRYMRLCFDLAEKGKGSVSPNPLVGALIVKNGQVISTGSHERYGSGHAERNAILNSTQDLIDATLYCNLEPCVHTNKQTPPCVPLIIEKGIKKVVVSNLDPNPEVNGKGIKALTDAGIEVITNVLIDEGCSLNKFFFKAMQTGKPYVTVKMAVSKDYKITAEKGKQTWLTGLESKKFVHSLRAEYDAVLVGANTVNIDNPQLTVREITGRDPQRIILDGKLNSNLDSRLFEDGSKQNIVICDALALRSRKEAFINKGIKLVEINSPNEFILDIENVLKNINTHNINSLLIEGGSKIFSQFLANGFFDELFVIESPIVLGAGIDAPALDLINDIKLINKSNLGKDTLYHYKKSA